MDFGSILVPKMRCSWMHPRPFGGVKPAPYGLVALLLHSYYPFLGFSYILCSFWHDLGDLFVLRSLILGPMAGVFLPELGLTGFISS